ncbi:MAG: acetoacetate--CoA ligase [Acidimicrobiia bacterium]
MTASFHDRGEILWSPPPDVRANSRIGQFLDWLEVERGLTFDDYEPLWQWSVDDLDGFWSAFTEWAGIRWHQRPRTALGRRAMPGAEWFPGATLNYAEHALAAAAKRPDDLAIVARSQTRDEVQLTWAELAGQVARCRAGLVRLGVQRGDRVAAYLPNIPETVVAFLAVASLGAIWSSCAPEFGVRSVVDRFAQIEPVVLLAVDGYRYGTKLIDRRDEVAEVEAALPTLRHTVHVPYAGLDARDDWQQLLAAPGDLAFDAVPFTHPLYVLYSSGTTGLPKAIVHGHGGITIEHQKTLALHHDLWPGQRFFWFTTTGWMMWNYLMSGLLVGATLVLFDGDPGSPDLGALWELAADTGVQVFGVSAPFVMACRKAGVVPPAHHVIRSVGSTGAPLPPDGFRWIHDAVGAHVQPVSVSGGTDVCAAFVGAVKLLPVRAGEITCRLLGCEVEAFDDDGRPCPTGVQGELVVTEPMPSMPVGFWGDPDGTKLHNAYFSDYPGVWRHGDWITFTDDGACVISGRSDATLNRGGVRLGTSDFYAVVESFAEITDALVVHLEGDDPEDPLGQLVLFVSLAPGAQLDDDLVGRIRARLRTDLSPRHVPDAIEAVPAVPHTLSGKKLEVPVKRILTGSRADDVASRSSLADPGALTWFEERSAHGSPK